VCSSDLIWISAHQIAMVSSKGTAPGVPTCTLFCSGTSLLSADRLEIDCTCDSAPSSLRSYTLTLPVSSLSTYTNLLLGATAKCRGPNPFWTLVTDACSETGWSRLASKV